MAITRTRRPTSPAITHHVFIVVLLPLITCYAAAFAYAMQHASYDVWGALWLAPVLIAVTVPVLVSFTQGEPDPRIGRLLIAALLLKLAVALPRYYMVAFTYGSGDSFRYADTAVLLRQDFLNGDFALEALGGESRTGTQFVEIVTGIVYTIIGPSFIGAFIFFSWLGFWGLYFFYRAFRVAVPNGNVTRYAMLLFFLPSLLFWPSSIGKEAWMLLVLGLTTYGCALLLARRRGATLYLALGLAGVLAVRPHVALLVVAGLGLGYLLRGFGARRAVALGRLRTVLGLVTIGALTLLVIRQVSRFFGIDEFNLDAATETLEYAEDQTGKGGSEFAGTGPSLTMLPRNLITVLFRPFPFEVHNLQALLTAVEGTLLLLIFVLSWPRLRTVPRQLFKQPYVTFCITYVMLFCFVFSSFQNFGILARERVMVFPFAFVLLALPVVGVRLWPDRNGKRTAGSEDRIVQPDGQLSVTG